MKKFVYVLSLVLLVSCASTKTVSTKISPVGSWDYIVTGTPEGDSKGVMIVSLQDKVYKAKLSSNAGELPIDKFVYDEATQKMKGEFDYSGTLVFFAAALATDDMNGTMSAGGSDFPFKATRKK